MSLFVCTPNQLLELYWYTCRLLPIRVERELLSWYINDVTENCNILIRFKVFIIYVSFSASATASFGKEPVSLIGKG